MPPKRKKFNSRFPPARVKKIMQTDDEVGKVAASVPILVSKAVEMFMQSLLTAASEQAVSKKVKTMSAVHMKMCIESERQFDFLKDLVANVTDVAADDAEGSGTGSGPVRKRKASSSISRASTAGAQSSAGDMSSTEESNSRSSQCLIDAGTPKKKSRTKVQRSPSLASPVAQQATPLAAADVCSAIESPPPAAPLPSSLLPSSSSSAAPPSFAPPPALQVSDYAAPFVSQFSAQRPDADDDDDYDA